MEPSEETPKWIPTSFSGTSETGDSVSSPVDPASDDQSFDAISRQKLNLVGQTTLPKPAKPDTPISMFEEDTRSSWSVEPPKQTPVPEGEFQQSLESMDCTPDEPFIKSIAEESKDNSPVKTQTEESQDSVFLKPQEEESLGSAFLKPQEDESQGDAFLKPLEDESQSSVILKPVEEESQGSVSLKPQEDESQGSVSLKPQEEESQGSVIHKPQEEESQGSPKTTPVKPASPIIEEPNEDSLSSVPLKPSTDEPQSNGVLKPQEEEQSQPNDVFLKPSEELPNTPKDATPMETSEVESEKKADEVTTREFPPEGLYEYMWPQEGGEFFMLQEQICDYLGLKAFRRKLLSGITRRPVDMEEKQFLREKNVVTEIQCDLGLTALRSEEVLELMSKDYPEHYAEYIRVLREREQRTASEKHREYAASNADKTKMVDLVRRAVQSAAEYNAHLNQERREERRSCMDLQTFTIHYPKTNKPKAEVPTKMGKYPVALLPGQFQDYYKEYSSDELKYLPVNTVLYGPLKELQGGESVTSDSEDSSASDGSCCSSSHEDSSSESEEKVTTEAEYKPKIKPNAVCKTCKKGSDSNSKDGEIFLYDIFLRCYSLYYSSLPYLLTYNTVYLF